MESSTSKPKHFLKLLTSLVGALAVVLGVVVAPKLMVREVSEDDIALSAAYDYPDNYVAPQRNNELPRECGINVAFVLDMSGSIGRLGKVKTQEAARQMVAELAGSPVNVGLFNFATEAPVNGESAQQTEPVSVFDDKGVETLNAKIDNLVTGSAPYDGTNWEGALNNVEKASVNYDVVFFITDGVPTTNDNQNSGYNTAWDPGTLTHNVDLSMAVEAANKLKAGGARIVPIAIGLDTLPTQPVFKSYVDRIARTTITGGAKPYFDGYGYVGYDGYGNPYYYRDRNGYIYDRVVHEVHASGAQWNTFFHSEDVLYYRTPQQMLDAVSGPGDTTYIQNYGELPQALVDQLRDLCKNSVLIEKVFQDEAGNEYSKTSQLRGSSIPRENFAAWDFTATNLNDPNFKLVDANGNQVKTLTNQATDKNGFKTLPYDFLNPGVDATGKVNIVESAPTDSDVWSPGTLSENGKAAYCYESDTEAPVNVTTNTTSTGLVDFDVEIKSDKTIMCKVANKYSTSPTDPPTPPVGELDVWKEHISGSPKLPATKTDTPQEFEMVYKISVKNNSETDSVDIQEDLVDQITYPEGWIINDAKAYLGESSQGTFKQGAAQNQAEIIIPADLNADGTGKTLEPGEVREYRVVVKAIADVDNTNLDLDPKGTGYECQPLGQDTFPINPTGFYNQVTAGQGEDSSGESNNYVCSQPDEDLEVNEPKFEVEKLAESDTAVREGEGVYSAPYLVTVRNTGTAPGNSGEVLDVPEPAAGFVIDKVTVDGVEVKDDNADGQYVISGGIELAAGRSDSFRVRVTYKESAKQDYGNMNLGACGDTTDGTPSRTGLANVVKLTNFDKEPKEDNDACVVLEEPDFKVAKENIGEGQVALNPDGTGEVQYKVTVTNNAAKSAMLPNPVIDNPDLPLGFTADEIKFELAGAENPIVISSPEADLFTLNPEWFGLFEGNQVKTVTVTVKVRANKTVMGELHSGTTKYQCEEKSTEDEIPAPKGLFNSVSLLGENDDEGARNNYDCQEPVVPGWKVEKSAPEKGVLIEAGVKPVLEYTVKVTNLGVQGMLENPVIDELTIPEGFVFEKADFALGENTESSNEQTYSLSPEFFGEFMAGETKEVKVTVTLKAPDAALADKVAENAEDYVCGAEEGEDGLPSLKTGFYNEVSLEGEVDGPLPKDNNHACITPETDGFRVEKKADSDVVTVSKEPVDVTYTVVVTNKGKDAANLEAPVVEKPQVPEGFTLSEVSFAMDGATTKTFSGATLADTYELEPTWFGEFAGRESKTIKVTMKVAAEVPTLDAIRENPQDFVCEDTSGLGDIPESFKGIANSVTLAGESEGLKPEHNNFDCVTPQVPSFETNKVVIGDGIAKKISDRDADGKEIPGIFAAKYKVDVVNNTMVPGNFGELFDVPNDVPGFKVVGVYAGDKSFALNKLEEVGGKYKLSGGEELAPGATRSFFVEVRYELLENATSKERMNASECAADNSGSFSNMGLENKVELETEPPTKEADNFACAKLPSFKLEKVAKSTAVQVTPGTTEVSYEISVTNNSAVRAGLLNDVIDTPVFPEGFTITAVRYNTPGAVELGRFTALYGEDGKPTSQRLPASWFGTFEPNETKTVTATFTIDVAESVAEEVESNPDAFACEARDGATNFPLNKTGLYNQVTLVGEVDGTNPNGNNFDCITPTTDPVSELDIVKKINGADADTEAAAVAVAPNEDMQVTYRVTNTGTTDLYHISVNDKIIEGDVVPVDAQPQDKKYPRGATKESEGIEYDGMLKPGEYVIFEATVKAPAGDAALHHNVAKAFGVPPTEGGGTPPPPGDGETPPVESPDDDGFAETPKLTVKKYINDDDAQDEPGVALESGKDMRIKYVITNDSGVNLYHVGLTDDVVKHDNGDVDAVETEINNRITAAIEELKRDRLNPWSGHLMAGESITVEVTHPAPSANADGKTDALHSNEAVASGVPPLTPPDHPKPGEPGYEDPDKPNQTDNFDPRDPRVPHPEDPENPPVESKPDPGNGYVTPTDTPQTPPTGQPDLQIVKKINGQDANTEAEAVAVAPGADMTVTYELTNNGDATAYHIDVNDEIKAGIAEDALEQANVDFNKVIDDAIAKQVQEDEWDKTLAPQENHTITVTLKAPTGKDGNLHHNVAIANFVPPTDDGDTPPPPPGENNPPTDTPPDDGYARVSEFLIEKQGIDEVEVDESGNWTANYDITVTNKSETDEVVTSDALFDEPQIQDPLVISDFTATAQDDKFSDAVAVEKAGANRWKISDGFKLAKGEAVVIEVTLKGTGAKVDGTVNPWEKNYCAPADAVEKKPGIPNIATLGEGDGALEAEACVPAVPPADVPEPGTPAIDVEKLINGEDADNRESAVDVAPGSDMQIQFIVKNTGNADLVNAKLTDDKVAGADVKPAAGYEQFVGFVNGEGAEFKVGETAIFTATFPAPEQGNMFHVNTAKVVGEVPSTDGETPPGAPTTVEDEDPAVAETPDKPSLTIRKKVNGFDTTEATPAIVKPGELMKLAFIVTNTGNTKVDNVTVEDDKVKEFGVELIAPDSVYDQDGNVVGPFEGSLEPGEYAVFTADMKAPEGNGEVHHNVAFAEGEVPPPGGDVPPTETETSTPPTGTEPSTPPTDGETPPTTTGETPPTTPGETPPKVTTPPDDGWAKTPSLSITKFINGEDANGTPDEKIPSVELTPGGDMRIHYLVHNDGDVVLNDVKVVDEVTLSTVGGEDNAEAKSALQAEIEKALDDVAPMTLQPGEKQSIFITVSAPEGNDEKHSNVAYAEGVPPSLTPPDSVPGEPEYPTDGGDTPPVKSPEDPGNGHTPPGDTPPDEPALDIRKKINGLDTTADAPATVRTGDDMLVSFIVTNTGNVKLDNVKVVDDVVPADQIEAPAKRYSADGSEAGAFDGTLEPGEYAVFTATIPAPEAKDGMDHHNTAHAEGEVPPSEGGEDTPPVTSDDDEGFAEVPTLKILKSINGKDANEAPGVEVKPGSDMAVTYTVTNTGEVALNDIKVEDEIIAGDNIGEVPAYKIVAGEKKMTADGKEVPFDGTLLPGETVVFGAIIKAPEKVGKQHTNVAQAFGTPPANENGEEPKPGEPEYPTDGGEVPPVPSNEDPANAITDENPGDSGGFTPPPWWPLIPPILIPLIPVFGGSSEGSSVPPSGSSEFPGSSEPGKPGSSEKPRDPAPSKPGTVTPGEPSPEVPAEDVPEQPEESNSVFSPLAETGASVIGLTLMAMLLMLVGLFLLRRKNAPTGKHSA